MKFKFDKKGFADPLIIVVAILLIILIGSTIYFICTNKKNEGNDEEVPNNIVSTFEDSQKSDKIMTDKTNANGITNAIERFTSQFELYVQDISCGTANGISDAKVSSVVGKENNTTKRIEENIYDKMIDRTTKYPLTKEAVCKIAQVYYKNTPESFIPSQDGKCFFYCPSCGVCVVADANSDTSKLNSLVLSGVDAKGNKLSENTIWINITK